MKNLARRLRCGIRALFAPAQTRRHRVRHLLAVSDRDALAADWTAVGNDIRYAMRTFGNAEGK